MSTTAVRRAFLAPSTLGALGLLGVTAAWGSTFFRLRDVVDRIPVPDFLSVRSSWRSWRSP